MQLPLGILGLMSLKSKDAALNDFFDVFRWVEKTFQSSAIGFLQLLS